MRQYVLCRLMFWLESGLIVGAQLKRISWAAVHLERLAPGLANYSIAPPVKPRPVGIKYSYRQCFF